MRPEQSGAAPSRQALIEASDWFVDFRVDDADAAAREAFDQWLRRSPEHIQAYLQIATTWSELSDARPQSLRDVQQLLACAREAGNVVPLVPVESRASRPARQRMRAGVRLLVAASVAGVALVAALSLVSRAPAYSTGIGEQRYVTLSDGSTVALNARSSVRVRFTGRQRVVELVEGQALFGIAKDRLRPFIVQSGGTSIRAVGTQFDVYRKSSGTTVTVLEGRVAVSAEALSGPAPADLTGKPSSPPSGDAAIARSRPTAHRDLIYLSAGEQLVVAPMKALAAVSTDVDAATAWTQRRLIFESSRLADVVDEFNRYNRRPLLLEGEALDDMRISGVYSSTDPASLLRFLRHQRGVSVVETEEGVRVRAQDQGR